MPSWKKILQSGSQADFLNVTSSEAIISRASTYLTETPGTSSGATKIVIHNTNIPEMGDYKNDTAEIQFRLNASTGSTEATNLSNHIYNFDSVTNEFLGTGSFHAGRITAGKASLYYNTPFTVKSYLAFSTAENLDYSRSIDVERMRIWGNPNNSTAIVGIGTTADGEQGCRRGLTVEGHISASGDFFLGKRSFVTGSGTTAKAGWHPQDFYNGSYISMSNGNIRISGDIIADRHIISSSTSYVTTNYSSGSTQFGDDYLDKHNVSGSLFVRTSTDDSDIFFVSSSGNIGIGRKDTFPNAKIALSSSGYTNTLQVDGDISASGDIKLSAGDAIKFRRFPSDYITDFIKVNNSDGMFDVGDVGSSTRIRGDSSTFEITGSGVYSSLPIGIGVRHAQSLGWALITSGDAKIGGEFHTERVNITADSESIITGSLTISSSAGLFTNRSIKAQNITPISNGYWHLGAPLLRWRRLYMSSEIDYSGSLIFSGSSGDNVGISNNSSFTASKTFTVDGEISASNDATIGGLKLNSSNSSGSVIDFTDTTTGLLSMKGGTGKLQVEAMRYNFATQHQGLQNVSESTAYFRINPYRANSREPVFQVGVGNSPIFNINAEGHPSYQSLYNVESPPSRIGAADALDARGRETPQANTTLYDYVFNSSPSGGAWIDFQHVESGSEGIVSHSAMVMGYYANQGTIGIGTTQPSASLHISGTITGSHTELVTVTNDNNVDIFGIQPEQVVLRNPLSSSAEITMSVDSSSNLSINDTIKINHTDVRITSPDGTKEVKLEVSNDGDLSFKDNNDSKILDMKEGGTVEVAKGTATSQSLTNWEGAISASGYVKVKNTFIGHNYGMPNNLLIGHTNFVSGEDITVGAATGFALSQNDNGLTYLNAGDGTFGGTKAILFYQAGTISGMFDNNRNLAIGTSTTNPNTIWPAKLTVEGNISSSGTIYAKTGSFAQVITDTTTQNISETHYSASVFSGSILVSGSTPGYASTITAEGNISASGDITSTGTGSFANLTIHNDTLSQQISPQIHLRNDDDTLSGLYNMPGIKFSSGSWSSDTDSKHASIFWHAANNGALNLQTYGGSVIFGVNGNMVSISSGSDGRNLKLYSDTKITGSSAQFDSYTGKIWTDNSFSGSAINVSGGVFGSLVWSTGYVIAGNDIYTSAGNIYSQKENGLISGSSTSTGSFGSVHTVGRVGIGTTTPNEALEVVGNISSSGTYFNSQTEHRFDGDISASGQLYVSNIRMEDNGSAIQGVSGEDYIQFSANNVTDIGDPSGAVNGTSLVIDDNNQKITTNVPLAVNTTTPATNMELTVAGDISASGDIISTGTGSFAIVSSSVRSYFPKVDVDDLITADRIRAQGTHLSLQAALDDISHITASGNISSSGTTGTHTLGGDLTLGRHLTIGGEISNVDTTHITASGNISASGTSHHLGGNLSIANEGVDAMGLQLAGSNALTQASNVLQLGIDNNWTKIQYGKLSPSHDFTGAITASGDISASGTIKGGIYRSFGNILGTYHAGSDAIKLSNDSDKTELRGTNITISGPVTASGDISSSGTIISSLTGVSGLNTRHKGSLRVDEGINSLSHITASGNISSSGNLIGNQLVVGGGTFTSASLAAGGGGGVSFPYSGDISASGDLDIQGGISASEDIYLGLGQHIYLDDDRDTMIVADYDDRIDFKVGAGGIKAWIGNGAIALGQPTVIGKNTSNTAQALTVDGDISGSGNFHMTGYGSHSFEGSVTASGAISASGNLYASDTTIDGVLTATRKSFLIPHPIDEDKQLQYASLEGPENGIYVRGKLKGDNIIELPDYWSELVDKSTITVSLTPVGVHQNLYVKDISEKEIMVGTYQTPIRRIYCHYVVYAERADIDKLEVEPDV